MTTIEDRRISKAASIVIPTWNRPEFLPGAVRSAVAALPANSEVVVTDDRSDPPAVDCLGEFAPDLVRVVANDGARGASANRNFGVSQAKGEVIFFLDDDDELRPGYPEAVLDLIQGRTPSWGFSTIAPVPEAPSDFPAPVVTQDIAGLPFRKKLGGLGCGFWVLRDLFVESGGIDETLSINEDTEFSLRLLAGGHEPVISAEPGVFVRRHEAGLTATSSPAERARCFRAIIERHAAYLSQHPDAAKHLRRRLLKMLAKNGQAKEGVAMAGRNAGDLGYFVAALAIARVVK